MGGTDPAQDFGDARCGSGSLSAELAGVVKINLPASLDMKAARPLKKELQSVLDSGSACLIDALSVHRVSTGCIQVLVAFLAAMKTAGRTAKLMNPSEALMAACKDVGLPTILEN